MSATPESRSPRYRVLRRLGTGGNATVYAVEDREEVGVRAVKILKDLTGAVLTTVRRLEREIDVCRELRHPNIIPILDHGLFRNTPFYVMPLIEGRSLDEVRRDDGPQSPALIARIGAQIASALAYLHDRRIVHRDVKPANILLKRPSPVGEGSTGAQIPEGGTGGLQDLLAGLDGDAVHATGATGDVRAILIDFGLCRPEDGTLLTENGVFMGSPRFVPPERVLAAVTGPEGDVYSLGASLYALATGTNPYQDAKDLREILQAIAGRRLPPVSSLIPDFPTDLSALIDDMVSPQPRARPPAAECERLLGTRVGPGWPARPASEGALTLPPRAAPDLDRPPPMRPDGSPPDRSGLVDPEHHVQLGDPSMDPTPESASIVSVSKISSRYQMLEALGEGAAGVVLRAHDRSLGRDVAIKFIRNRWIDDRRLIKRFENEARLLSRLRHPGILRIYDFGRDGDGIYLVSELNRDGTLRARLQAEGTEVTDLVRGFLRCLDSLVYLHEQGILHRDLKPENIFLRPDGDWVVGDFGLAQDEGLTTRLTRSGQVLGTLRYLAPEVLLGAPHSTTSEVYAMGVILHEILHGCPPYTSQEVLLFTCGVVPRDRPDEPGPGGERERLARLLTEPLDRAIAFPLEDRFPDIPGFRTALISCLGEAATASRSLLASVNPVALEAIDQATQTDSPTPGDPGTPARRATSGRDRASPRRRSGSGERVRITRTGSRTRTLFAGLAGAAALAAATVLLIDLDPPHASRPASTAWVTSSRIEAASAGRIHARVDIEGRPVIPVMLRVATGEGRVLDEIPVDLLAVGPIELAGMIPGARCAWTISDATGPIGPTLSWNHPRDVPVNWMRLWPTDRTAFLRLTTTRACRLGVRLLPEDSDHTLTSSTLSLPEENAGLVLGELEPDRVYVIEIASTEDEVAFFPRRIRFRTKPPSWARQVESSFRMLDGVSVQIGIGAGEISRLEDHRTTPRILEYLARPDSHKDPISLAILVRIAGDLPASGSRKVLLDLLERPLGAEARARVVGGLARLREPSLGPLVEQQILELAPAIGDDDHALRRLAYDLQLCGPERLGVALGQLATSPGTTHGNLIDLALMAIEGSSGTDVRAVLSRIVRGAPDPLQVRVASILLARRGGSRELEALLAAENPRLIDGPRRAAATRALGFFAPVEVGDLPELPAPGSETDLQVAAIEARGQRGSRGDVRDLLVRASRSGGHPVADLPWALARGAGPEATPFLEAWTRSGPDREGPLARAWLERGGLEAGLLRHQIAACAGASSTEGLGLARVLAGLGNTTDPGLLGDEASEDAAEAVGDPGDPYLRACGLLARALSRQPSARSRLHRVAGDATQPLWARRLALRGLMLGDGPGDLAQARRVLMAGDVPPGMELDRSLLDLATRRPASWTRAWLHPRLGGVRTRDRLLRGESIRVFCLGFLARPGADDPIEVLDVHREGGDVPRQVRLGVVAGGQVVSSDQLNFGGLADREGGDLLFMLLEPRRPGTRGFSSLARLDWSPGYRGLALVLYRVRALETAERLY